MSDLTDHEVQKMLNGAHVTRANIDGEWRYWVTCGKCVWQTPSTHLLQLAELAAWNHNRKHHAEGAA